MMQKKLADYFSVLIERKDVLRYGLKIDPLIVKALSVCQLVRCVGTIDQTCYRCDFAFVWASIYNHLLPCAQMALVLI